MDGDAAASEILLDSVVVDFPAIGFVPDIYPVGIRGSSFLGVVRSQHDSVIARAVDRARTLRLRHRSSDD